MDQTAELNQKIYQMQNEIITLNNRILVLQLENEMLRVKDADLRFFTPEQVADRLQVSITTIKRFIQDGRLIAFQAEKGGNYRISQADLMDFIRRNTIDRLEVCEC